MLSDNGVRVLVLEEFRLHAADVDGAAARIVAGSTRGIEPGIPLLTSIEDRRDVAVLRGLHAGESTESDTAQHEALDHLVTSWAAPKHYGSRIAERSESPPSSYRLAVTESGINAGDDPRRTTSRESVDRTTSRPVGLLWIGTPVGTHAGLLVLVGAYDDDPRAVGDEPFGWPLPFSRELGVRIYENGRK